MPYFVAFLLLMFSALPASAEKRVALVIGNSDYSNAVPLKNPHNDAADMANALRDLDFEVVEGVDLTYLQMRDKVQTFSRSLVGADVALFFYAGHAVQVNGKNYLAPIDTDLERQSDLDFETISLDFVQRQMENEADALLIFLDACRDNPLTRRLVRLSRSLSAGTGLAEPKISPKGTFIAFATEPGNVALDGLGRNSPFTSALLKHIHRPGVEISSLMTDVRIDVYNATEKMQRPWINSGLLGRFYFKEADPNQITVLPEPVVDSADEETEAVLALKREQQAWADIQSSTDPEDFRTFLTQHPDGLLSAVAEFRLNQLITAQQKVKPEPNQPETEIASLSPALSDETSPSSSEIVEPVTEVTVRSIQAELNRLGCGAGKPDGKWGRKSNSALLKFRKHSDTKLASVEPSHELLNQLKLQKDNACPITCSVREIEKDGQCILKTCPAKQRLSSQGKCYTPQKKQATNRRTTTRSSKSNCVKLMGETICD